MGSTEEAVKCATDARPEAIRLANYLRSHANREGQNRRLLARGVNRDAAACITRGSGFQCRFAESGQASLNACGVRPVHRRNDR